MRTSIKSKKSRLYMIGSIALILLIAVILLIHKLFFSNSADDRFMKADLNRLSSEQYDSVFLSMHSIQNYKVQDFLHIRGTQTVIGAHKILSMKELAEYLKCVFASDNTVTNIFLSLDPYLIKDIQKENSESLYQGLYSYMEAYPDVSFEIILPYPSLDYWLNREDSEISAILASYLAFVEKTAPYENALTYFFGHEYWLIGNPANYGDDPFTVNPVISQKIIMYSFCDHKYQIDTDNAASLIDSLSELITREKTDPTYYPDLSGTTLIFFGDSVIDYVSGSYSIPGYISGLSGATAYNYAHSGTRASTQDAYSLDFPNILDDFFNEYCTLENGRYLFGPEGTPVPEESLYFITNYGLNDYFQGAAPDNSSDPYDIRTYGGGLRNSISILQEAFPSANFVILTPNFTSYYSNGTDRNSEDGGQLTDYVEKALQVARDLDVYGFDCYNGYGIDETNWTLYLADGCHPNESGRLTIATYLMYRLEDIYQRR